MINGIGGMDMSSINGMRPQQRPSPEEMFQKLDTDGSNSLDEMELQAMIDRMSERMGGENVPSVDDMMAKLDGDGDGVVSQEELEAGRPAGPPPGGMPPGMDMSTDRMSLLDLYSTEDEEQGVGVYA